MMAPPRILITGANGFIGTAITAKLNASGTIFCGITHCAIDLLNPGDELKKVLAAFSPTHLLHLAWNTTPGQFWNAPENRDWTAASVNLVTTFIQMGGKHVVVAGSCAEYDWSDDGICDEESTPLKPNTLYGQEKVRAHQLIDEICKQHAIRCAWARIFFPYGEHQPEGKLIPDLEQVFSGQRPAFAVQRHQRRDFIHVDDVADGFITLLDQPVNGAFNLASGQSTTIAEIVETLAHLHQQSPEIIFQQRPEANSAPVRIEGTNDKLKQLGWAPSIPLSTGLARVVASTSHASGQTMASE